MSVRFLFFAPGRGAGRIGVARILLAACIAVAALTACDKKEVQGAGPAEKVAPPEVILHPGIAGARRISGGSDASAEGSQAQPEPFNAHAVAMALGRRWRSQPGAFRSTVNNYQIETSLVITEPPQDAAPSFEAAAALSLKGESRPFDIAMVTYTLFDSVENAIAYFKFLDHNGHDQAQTIYAQYRIKNADGSATVLRCTFIADAENAVNCHFMGPENLIVGVVLFAHGPPIQVTPGVTAIDTIFNDPDSSVRLLNLSGAASSYLDATIYE